MKRRDSPPFLFKIYLRKMVEDTPFYGLIRILDLGQEVAGLYIRKRYIFDGSVEVEESHNGNYGAPGEKRGKRKKVSPEVIKKQNQWNKEKNIRRLAKWNFKTNDYWITLTYKKEARPPDMKAAKKDIEKFMGKMRRYYKKKDVMFKWMLATEIGSRGGVHHHLIMSRVPDGDLMITKNWTLGGAHIQLLYEQGDFRDLASYIAKQPDEENKFKGKRFSRSRNLISKDPEKKIMKRGTFEKEPRVPQGYYLDKTSLVEGINPVTGYKYRHYTLVKIKRRE